MSTDKGTTLYLQASVESIGVRAPGKYATLLIADARFPASTDTAHISNEALNLMPGDLVVLNISKVSQ